MQYSTSSTQHRARAQAARTAIQLERYRRGHDAVVTNPVREVELDGLPIPDGVEAWSTFTYHQTQEQDRPCAWVDFAFFRPDGWFYVVLSEDFFCPGFSYREVLAIWLKALEQASKIPIPDGGTMHQCEYAESLPCPARATTRLFIPPEEGSSASMYLCDHHIGKTIGDLLIWRKAHEYEG